MVKGAQLHFRSLHLQWSWVHFTSRTLKSRWKENPRLSFPVSENHPQWKVSGLCWPGWLDGQVAQARRGENENQRAPDISGMSLVTMWQKRPRLRPSRTGRVGRRGEPPERYSVARRAWPRGPRSLSASFYFCQISLLCRLCMTYCVRACLRA